MAGSATVIGSLNMDMAMRVARLPNAGETTIADGFTLAEGGKGANQAVALARMGARVAMVGKVGADDFGAQLRAALQRDGIDVEHVVTAENCASGAAMILVEPSGENRIMVAPGANLSLAAADIDAASGLIGRSAFVVLQLEVPMATVDHAARLARSSGVRVVLNPAPADTLPAGLWSAIDYLIPNESEAERLTGIRVQDHGSAIAAARALRDRGVANVVITLGAKGALLSDASGERVLPARVVKVRDTTAAGDCFIGGLVAGLCEDMALDQAALLGIAAAGVCVTRTGAQPSLPYRTEVS